MISGFYWYTADGQILDAHQDKKGALAISPPIVLLAGKHGVSHNGLILPTDVAVVWIVSEAPLLPSLSSSPSEARGTSGRFCFLQQSDCVAEKMKTIDFILDGKFH